MCLFVNDRGHFYNPLELKWQISNILADGAANISKKYVFNRILWTILCDSNLLYLLNVNFVGYNTYIEVK